jgi:hypothetical protein
MRYILLVAGAILLVSCNSGGSKPKLSKLSAEPASATAIEAKGPAETETLVEMLNVNMHADAKLVLHIRHLTGKFVPTRKGQPPTFDDTLSYTLAIDSGEVAVSMASMSYALNTYAFGEPDAPLKNLQLSAEGSQIRQKGTLMKGVGIPFEMVATIGPTPDGRIRVHPTQMTVAHLPVKGLMNLFGLDMAKLVNTRQTRGVSVDESDLILDPARMLPPPQMRGRITAVRVQGDEIVQIFGKETPDSAAAQPRSNYMAYRGGILRFGKLTMNKADM